MPRLIHARPRYRKHRASGQAIVEFGGRTHYLGRYGSPASQEAYDRLVRSWLDRGRGPAENVVASVVPATTTPREFSVTELIAQFWEYAESRYVKYDRPTGTRENYRPALRRLRQRCGDLAVSAFGPKALKELQQSWIADGLSRRYINDNIDRIRRVFSWGVSEELVTPQVNAALAAVESVPKGARDVLEHPPVEPISEAVVEQTLPHLPRVVADMVRFQLLTGCRPGEVCILRAGDVDQASDEWLYRPQFHKTEHHGKQRVIVIGPRAQAVLKPYLARSRDAYCFVPAESERERNGLRRLTRQTPLPRTAPSPSAPGRRAPGDRYTNHTYRRAITRACGRAFPPPKTLDSSERDAWRRAHAWSPNQLRHTAATKICSRFESLLAAKETLGHSSVRTTEIYAAPSLELAKRAMRELG